MITKELFDEWPQRYDQWFTTPIGKVVKEIESKLILELLKPERGEKLLDAGCGTGVFTLDYLAAGSEVIGLDISRPMLDLAGQKTMGSPFYPVQGDMLRLPFRDDYFAKTVSVTALEFIADARAAVDELFRVTRPGGCVVIATLNSLSPWAARRRAKTREHILQSAFFRTPDELLACSPFKGTIKTAIHFHKDDNPEQALEIENQGSSGNLNTGAFIAARWEKPGVYQNIVMVTIYWLQKFAV